MAFQSSENENLQYFQPRRLTVCLYPVSIYGAEASDELSQGLGKD